MKIFVLGCNGMAGHTISLYFKEQGNEVLGFDRAKSRLIPSIAGDAAKIDELKKILSEGGFDAVINCIGLLNQFAEENKALAVFLNSFFPHFIAEECKKNSARLIHMSTDCVFSGKKGSYTEQDFRDGESFYDRTKALGELDYGNSLTLRNSIVGPDINPKGIGLLNWFMQQSGEVNGFTRAMWTGQTTLQLAKTMEQALKEGASGLVNAVPNESISKHDLLCLFNKYLRNNSIKINAVDGINLDKSLKRTNFEFKYEIPSYEEMVLELAQWLKNHSRLYPHYSL